MVQTKVIYRAIIQHDSYDEPLIFMHKLILYFWRRPRKLNHIINTVIFNNHLNNFTFIYLDFPTSAPPDLPWNYMSNNSERGLQTLELWFDYFLYLYQSLNYFCASVSSSSKYIYKSVILGRGRAVFISTQGFDINLLFSFCLKDERVISEQRRKWRKIT